MIEITPKPTKNLNFLWDSLKRRLKGENISWLCLEGSSRSGKTWSIISFLVCLCLEPKILGKESITVRCYRNDGTTCRDTVAADFEEIMTGHFGGESGSGKWVSLFEKAGKWNKSTLSYRFNNGSVFSFGGANAPQKLHGKKADISWFNEAMEISDAARYQIALRTTTLFIADWNPSETDHWIFDTIMTDGSPYAYCHSTYKDNIENLTPQQIYEIECTKPTPENMARGTADLNKWLVYGEGKRGVRENLVFERWRWDIIEDDKFPAPQVCQRYGLGLDFGFSLDPTAIVECALFQDQIYVRQLVYERRLLAGRSFDNPDHPSIVGALQENGIPQYVPISADSAASENIAQIRVAGYNIHGTKKPEILEGIGVMKQHRIFITRSSNNIINEFSNYAFIKKPSGEITDEPEDKNNHAIDAIRYWAWDNLRATNIAKSNKRAILPKVRDFEDW